MSLNTTIISTNVQSDAVHSWLYAKVEAPQGKSVECPFDSSFEELAFI